MRCAKGSEKKQKHTTHITFFEDAYYPKNKTLVTWQQQQTWQFLKYMELNGTCQ